MRTEYSSGLGPEQLELALALEPIPMLAKAQLSAPELAALQVRFTTPIITGVTGAGTAGTTINHSASMAIHWRS